MSTLLLWSLVVTLTLSGGKEASAGATSCTFNPTTHVLTVVPGNDQVSIYRDGDDIEAINTDCGDADRFSVDTVVINDPDGISQGAFVSLSGGKLAPGFTNEPGSSDEIELRYNLGDGYNTFNAHLSGGRDNARGGYVDPASGPPRAKVNLNAGESTGVDADVTIFGNIESFSFEGFSGEDTLDQRGGAGTGNPYPHYAYLYGGDLNDSLFGGPGETTIYGGPGNELVNAGRGRDRLNGDEGRDRLNGAGGVDECEGGPGIDEFINCE